MAELPPELGPQAGTQNEQTPQFDSAGAAMRVGVEDEAGEFITYFVELLESKGIDLDDAISTNPEDVLDVASGDVADINQFLTEDDLVQLVTRFVALPPELQGQLETEFRKVMPPEFIQRLETVKRFVIGKS